MVLLQTADASGWMNMLLIVALIAIFYFFMIRPQQKRQNEIKKFRDGLSVGAKVVTAGGIYGKIKAIHETTFVIEVTSGVSLTVDKNSVYPSAAEAGENNQTEK